MIDKNRLLHLREKYGKRDGSTYYPEEPEFDVVSWRKSRLRPFWRVRRFPYFLSTAIRAIFFGYRITGICCACIGTCHVYGMCLSYQTWRPVYRYLEWRERRSLTGE